MSQKSKPFEITIIKGMALLIPLSIFMLFFSFLGFDLDVYYYTLFEQPKRGEKKIKITAKIVNESLDGILEDQDLSRYIL